jgi:uncharacterized coiled-coil protein SlyX
MDKNFLEFWGNMMLNAAKGQEQMDQMSKWIQQGFTGMSGINDMFNRFYGIKPKKTEMETLLETQQEAFSNFNKSFEDFLAMFDLIPRKKYQEMVDKYESEKKRVESLKETIGHLETMSDNNRSFQEDALDKFNKIVNKQADQFKKLMEDFNLLKPAEKAGPKKTTKKKS